MRIKRQNKKRLIIFISITMVLLLGAGATSFYFLQQNDNRPKETEAKTKADKGEEKPRETSESSQVPSTIQDTQGAGAENEGKGTKSQYGSITLQRPIKNEKVGNQSIISGVAMVSPVMYRIVDTQRGVIARGELNTVDGGKFSAKIQSIQPSSNSGTFEIFYISPSTGKESESIKIPVRF